MRPLLTRFRELLEHHRDELARLACEEYGKTLADTAGSVQRGGRVRQRRSATAEGRAGRGYGPRRGLSLDPAPVGVCAGITPFNLPFMEPLWMFPLAIACGNTFALKLSEKVPSCSLRMAELFKQAGLRRPGTSPPACDAYPG